MDVKELEARFKEIDRRSKLGPVEVSLKGKSKSGAKLKVAARRSVKKNGGHKGGARGGAFAPGESDAAPSTETLLDINLADVEVPDKYVAKKVNAILSNDETVGDLPGVKVMQLGATGNYKVVEDYTYDSGSYKITALDGFVYDRASIPRIFWVIIDKDDLSNVPPLFHDLLYRSGGKLPKGQVSPYRTFVRKDVDDLFLELMLKSGVTRWRARLAYEAVRRFADSAWKG